MNLPSYKYLWTTSPGGTHLHQNNTVPLSLRVQILYKERIVWEVRTKGMNRNLPSYEYRRNQDIYVGGERSSGSRTSPGRPQGAPILSRCLKSFPSTERKLQFDSRCTSRGSKGILAKHHLTYFGPVRIPTNQEVLPGVHQSDKT